MSMSYNRVRSASADSDSGKAPTMPPRAHRLRPLVLLLLLGVAADAWAGTVYVPLPGITGVGTATWEAELTHEQISDLVSYLRSINVSTPRP